MTIVQLLRAVVATEALVLVLLLAALAATASYAAARRRRDRARLARVMGSQAGGGTKTPAAELSHRFAQLPRRLRLATLADLTGPVHGTASELILRQAGSADLIGEAAGWCRSRRWWRRLRAVRTLSLLGEGADTVPALFADPHPQVRAAAAAWAVDHPDPALADRLVDMLDDPMLRCRFAAKAALLRIGRRGVRPLVRYLTAPDVHRLASALEVAAGLAEPALLAPRPPALPQPRSVRALPRRRGGRGDRWRRSGREPGRTAPRPGRDRPRDGCPGPRRARPLARRTRGG